MSALEDMNETMETEREVHKEDLEIHQNAIWDDVDMNNESDGSTPQKKTKSDEEMKIFATGPVNVHQGDHNQENEKEAVTQPPVEPKVIVQKVPVAVEEVSNNNVAKNLIAGGLAAAGIGLGTAATITAYNLTKPTPVEDTDTNTGYMFRILPDEEVK